jgi:ribonucleotide monophosphatase NagD (HAD superfamily)
MVATCCRRGSRLCSDLDGTIYRGEEVIPGAPQTIAELRRRGCGVVFLSNKPLERRQAYAEKLTRLGIPTSPDEVINSSLVLARYLANSEHGMAGATVFETLRVSETLRVWIDYRQASMSWTTPRA